ncbi:hypothetical protein WCLP8_1290003 [uncultured Gammaproteobacteria bacterium]
MWPQMVGQQVPEHRDRRMRRLDQPVEAQHCAVTVTQGGVGGGDFGDRPAADQEH